MTNKTLPAVSLEGGAAADPSLSQVWALGYVDGWNHPDGVVPTPMVLNDAATSAYNIGVQAGIAQATKEPSPPYDGPALGPARDGDQSLEEYLEWYREAWGWFLGMHREDPHIEVEPPEIVFD